MQGTHCIMTSSLSAAARPVGSGLRPEKVNGRRPALTGGAPLAGAPDGAPGVRLRRTPRAASRITWPVIASRCPEVKDPCATRARPRRLSARPSWGIPIGVWGAELGVRWAAVGFSVIEPVKRCLDRSCPDERTHSTPTVPDTPHGRRGHRSEPIAATTGSPRIPASMIWPWRYAKPAAPSARCSPSNGSFTQRCVGASKSDRTRVNPVTP